MMTTEGRTMNIQPLKWPIGWPRARCKTSGVRFSQQDSSGMRSPVTLNRAEAMLRDELGKLGAKRVLVTVGGGGGAAAVYFTRGTQLLVMAQDAYDSDAANLRSIGRAIEGMRTLERHGGGAMMDRAFAGFAALPAPRSCWETLGI